MAFLRVSFMGKSIGLQSSMNILLPESGPGPFPVFYLLHGLSDDHNAWMRRTAIERYVSNLPLIVVMPATGRNWYTNSASDPQCAYEDHIIKDVIGFVDNAFPTKKSRNARAIGGLSMGGYGAMKLALKYPQLFCSASSHSGAVFPFPQANKKQIGRPLTLEFAAIFGNNPRGKDNDPIALARKCPKNLRPKLRLDCGEADFLLAQNREFHQQLNKIPYPHIYEELPADPDFLYTGALNKWTGGHEWHYWDVAVQDAIVFHCQNMKIPVPFIAQRPKTQ